MFSITKICARITLFCFSAIGALAQWSPAESGTTNDLHGVYLLDSGVGYAVGDAGTILKSEDFGVTWNALVSGTTRALYDVYFLNDEEGVTVGDNGTILRTTDGGTSWLSVTSGVREGLRSVSFNGASGICGGLSQDILYSSDSGETWNVSQSGFFGGGFFGAQMISPTVGFVTGQNSIFQGLQGTTMDGGAHWSFHTFYFNGNEGAADDVFFFDDRSGLTSGVLFDGTGAIARTSNGGTSWSSTLFPNGLQGIDFATNDTGFTAGYFGTILRSDDAGMNWAAQTSGTTFDLFDVSFAGNSLAGVAVGAAGTILRTTNGGQPGGLELLAAASRKGHFEIDLPLTGPPGIECRSGGNSGSFILVLTFDNQLASVDSVASSCGTVTSSTINQANATQFLVSLAGVDCNAENLTLTVMGVQDDGGNILPSTSVTMSLLLGDVSGDGVVDSTDVRQTKRDLGERTDASNFREDINTNNRIDGADFSIIKGQVGFMLRP